MGEGEQRVKGAKAGWKACPTKTACPQKGVCDTGADTLGGPYTARRLEVERAVMRATPPVLAAGAVWGARTDGGCVAPPARLPAWQAWRLAPQAAAS